MPASPALAPGPAEGLCLDFANTRYWRGSPAPTEGLSAPAALLDWCAAAGLLEPAMLERLRAAWTAAPEAGEAALAAAIALREALFALLAAEAAGGPPAPAALAAVEDALVTTPPRRRLRRGADGYAWEVPADSGWSAALAPVLWSAGDLLAGPRRDRLRQCANPQCGWLFLDDSKPGTRRWCSMASCGNRAKAQRHYRRKREAAAG